MIILVSGATKTFRRFQGRRSFGHLKTPRNGNCIESIVATGHPWAADNDAFSAWDQERFWRMLRQIGDASDLSRFLWVTVPDIVADAQATINRWHEWYPQIEAMGLPAAFAGQDGLASVCDQIPWHDMRCFFIGGSTDWKLSVEAERFAREAKARGKLVHMGRCQTLKRIRHAIEIGCDSVDGKSFSCWPDKYFPKALKWLHKLEPQGCLLPHR